MYSRSLTERIKIQAEILYENLLDFLSHSAFRKPLLAFAGIAIFVTLRNSKHMISTIKHSSYLSPFNSRYASSNLSSLYGSAATGLGTNRATTSTSYGGTTSTGSYGATSYAGLGGASSYSGGTQYNSNPSSSTYGVGGTTSSYPQSYGQSSMYNSNNLRGTQSSTSTFSTSRLVDQYRTSVQVVQGGLFHDYGMSTSFSGQIETISAMESPTFVQQTLSSPGNGKVLVVDGVGSFNGAVFDASMANVAISNGWKGIIINGVVRNAQELSSIQFGVKALGAHPMPGQQQASQRGTPLSFGGVSFNPGNYVYADKEGIVVSATSLGVGGGMTSPTTMGSSGYGATTSYGTGYSNTGMGGSTLSTGQANSYTSPGSSYATTAGTSMNSYSSTQSTGYAGGQGSNMYSSTNMGRTGSNYGATSSYGQQSSYGSSSMTQGGYPSSSSYSSTSGRSPFSRSSTFYGSRRKKPSKKTLLGLLFLVCLLGWICNSD